MKTFLYTLLLVCLTTELLHAQHLEDCAIDYKALKKSVFMEPEQVSPDKAIFLSANYVQRLEEGGFDGETSGLIFYEYVRPASKKELKTQEIENPGREKIASDGKIYVPKASSGKFHFFQPTKIFQGEYRPRFMDPNLIVPMGLKPFDILPYADKKFWVVEKKADYILLEVEKQRVVYFLDYPKMEEVFETQEYRDDIAAKGEQASRLLNKDWFIRNKELPKYRSESELAAPQDIFYLAPLIELNFTASKVNQLETTLFTENDSITIDEQSIFNILDKNCVLGQQRSYVDRLKENFESENVRLQNTLRKKAQEDWSKDPWVKETLFKRFWLLPSKRVKSSYQYVLLDKEESWLDSYLYATTDIEGNAQLTSHFTSENGLYFNRIIVYKGSRRDSLESSRVSTRDRNSNREYTEDFVIEEVTFDGEEDEAILRSIAFNAHRKIRVRFKAGGKYYHDIILDDFHKQEIRDVYMLSKILKNSPFAQGEMDD